MSGGIYLRHGDRLIAMTEQSYAAEDVLQKLLEDYPELLAGDVEGESRLLISREAALASDDVAGGRWSVDHLFVDQDGVPTIVEVKRSCDTRIRREVVGQMLDYAANAVVYWRLGRLRAMFEQACEKRGSSGPAALAAFLGSDDEAEAEAFWEDVKTNLAAGKLRPPRSRVAAITGAPSGVLMVAASAFRPRTSRLLPWILVWPNAAPCLACP
jgi:hypothetical protein